MAGSDDTPRRYLRRVIHICAEDSPNVKLGLAQKAAGVTPTDDIIIPGVMPYGEYIKRKTTWDPQRRCIGLDGRFWEGAEVMLYPGLWLDRAARLATLLEGTLRTAEGMGVDPGEGVAETAWAIGDRYGLFRLEARPTPDPGEIVDETIRLIKTHSLLPERVCMDAGGGGLQVASTLKRMGYPVRTVGFGEGVVLDLKRGMRRIEERKDNRWERYAYKNRRAEMYGRLRELLDPKRTPEATAAMGMPPGTIMDRTTGTHHVGFALPGRFMELRRQLSPIPLTRDGEGRLELLPKQRRAITDMGNKGTAHLVKPTLIDLLGCSPDQADAVVLMVHAMVTKVTPPVAGGVRPGTGKGTANGAHAVSKK